MKRTISLFLQGKLETNWMALEQDGEGSLRDDNSHSADKIVT